MSETWTCGRCGIADAGVLNLGTGNAYHPEWAHCVTALRQQLADVAYLEEWRAADRLKHNIGHAPHDTEWHAYVMGGDQDSCYWGVMVSAPSLPALGARLRAMREKAS